MIDRDAALSQQLFDVSVRQAIPQVPPDRHAFVQNIRRNHYELGTEEVVNLRVQAAFDELGLVI
jgi:hypothetical protein